MLVNTPILDGYYTFCIVVRFMRNIVKIVSNKDRNLLKCVTYSCNINIKQVIKFDTKISNKFTITKNKFLKIFTFPF